jgi:apolipoprotein N-acyltransferase
LAANKSAANILARTRAQPLINFMPQSPDASSENQIPLCVDLDGTVIKTDLLWESLARLLRRHPLQIFPVLFWWIRGRAFLKKKLVARVKIDPATLPYHEPFLAWLREQKNAGRKIVLATASDLQMALPVANHLGLFDEVLGSDGKTNLRSGNKLKVLTEKFGARGFDYAGNSTADLAVWRGAREAIVVNASRGLLNQAAQCTKLGPTFIENYSSLEILKSFLNDFFIRSGYLLAIFAGLVLTAAFPRINIAGFAWIAPALILFAARGKNSGDAFRVGYVAGLTYFLSSLYWLLLIPVTGFPILGWIALSWYLAFYPAAWTWLLAGKIGQGNWIQRTFWSLSGAAIWVALEMIRARLFGGFPWDFIGTSQVHLTPLIQIASVTGVYGVSFLVVWTSLSFYCAGRMIFSKPTLRYAWQSEIFLALTTVIVLFALGYARMNKRIPASSTLGITLVQPSIPQTLIWNKNANSNRFQQLLTLSDNALTNDTDLLIWPESAVPEFDAATFDAISNIVSTHHIWMVFNADDAVWRADATNLDDYDDYNAAFLFDPNGNCDGIYHKQKLVAFGEYIPLVHWLPFVKWFTPIQGGYAAGHRAADFDLGGLNIHATPLICFEDTFPRLARKAVHKDTDFIINLTNDGWFGQSAEQWQHMENAVFRAVENGVPLVRCCNNGVSCWVDSDGRVRKILRDAAGSVYGDGAMTIQLPLHAHTQTFFNRYGDWFGWLCVILATVITAIRFFTRGKKLQQ